MKSRPPGSIWSLSRGCRSIKLSKRLKKIRLIALNRNSRNGSIIAQEERDVYFKNTKN
jgi:hypothetical protein